MGAYFGGVYLPGLEMETAVPFLGALLQSLLSLTTWLCSQLTPVLPVLLVFNQSHWRRENGAVLCRDAARSSAAQAAVVPRACARRWRWERSVLYFKNYFFLNPMRWKSACMSETQCWLQGKWQDQVPSIVWVAEQQRVPTRAFRQVNVALFPVPVCCLSALRWLWWCFSFISGLTLS